MFTGVVAGTGTVAATSAGDGGRRLRVRTDALSVPERGASVGVSGVCLTVEAGGEDWFDAFLASETEAKTTLGDLEVGDAVNLERPLAADGRLEGHFVQGHVDTTTTVERVEARGEDRQLVLALPAGHERYVADRGSVALDGVSLTVARVGGGTFEVALIPETIERTTLGAREAGDRVNVEVDVLAKYVERMTAGD